MALNKHEFQVEKIKGEDRVMKRIVFLLVVSFILTACGQGFEQGPTNGLNNQENLGCLENCSGGGSDIMDPPNGNDSVLPPVSTPELNGKVSGGVWDGKELLKLDLANLSLLVRVPIDFEASIVAGAFPIPGNSDLTLEFVTDDNNAKHLQLRIPLSRLLNETKLPNERGLPNGDGLPMVPGGKLPHVQTRIGSTDVHFYTGKGVASLFVPTSFNPFITLVFPIKNKEKEVLGHFATIAEKGASKGGFYVSVALPDKLRQVIDNWLPTQPD